MDAQTRQSRSRAAVKYLTAAAIGAAGLHALNRGLPRGKVIKAMERAQKREDNSEKNPVGWGSGVSRTKFQTYLDSCGQNQYDWSLNDVQKKQLHEKFNLSPVFRRLILILHKAAREPLLLS